MQLELPSRVGLVFLPFLAEKDQVGSAPLSLVVIDKNFWTKLLNFRETFFFWSSPRLDEKRLLSLNSGKTFFLTLAKKATETRYSTHISGQRLSEPTHFLVQAYPLLVVRAKPTSFGWSIPTFLFRKATLNATTLYILLG